MWGNAAKLLGSGVQAYRDEHLVRCTILEAYAKAESSCNCVRCRCEEVLSGAEHCVPVTRVSANELRNRLKRDVSEVALAHVLVHEFTGAFPWVLMTEQTKNSINAAVMSLGVQDEFVMQTFLKMHQTASKLAQVFAEERRRLYMLGKELASQRRKGLEK